MAFARGAAAIYLPDGTQPTNVAVGDLFIYDSINSRWERVANLSASVGGGDYESHRDAKRHRRHHRLLDRY